MKKNILKLTLVAAIALGAGWNLYQNEKRTSFSDMMLNNVEALASGEDSGDCLIANCRWSDGETCNYTCNGTSFQSTNMYNK